MRKFLEYVFTEGKTPLSGPELTRRFTDIDGRLHVLEELKVGWEAAVLQVQNHGLERINNVLQPLLDQAQAQIDGVSAALADILSTWEGDRAAILAEWQVIQDGWAALAGDFAALQAQAADHEARLTALAKPQAVYRHDHPDRIALRPSGTGTWAPLVTGEAGRIKLVCPFVVHTQNDYTTRTGGLSQDGGVTFNVDFDITSGQGAYRLGALVVDSANVILAGRAGYSNDLAYWAQVMDAPLRVKRLDGIPDGAAMLAVPPSGAPAVLHTATKRERVTIYAGRAAGTTDTKFVYAMGETTAGSGSLVASVSLDVKAAPVILWTGVLNAGESIKVGSPSANYFWAWGYAQEVEA